MEIKNLIKKVFVLLLVLFVASCQDEVYEASNTSNPQDTLVADSDLERSLRTTLSRDIFINNFIGGRSCYKVKLPIDVIANGVEVEIKHNKDFKEIRKIFKESDSDDDILEIIFPITLYDKNEHVEFEVNSQDELDELIENCETEEEEEEVDCISIQYPISASIYDANNQVIDTVTINDSEEFDDFIDDVLDGNLIASLNFPITLILSDASTIEVNNNMELLSAINEAMEDCD